MEYLGAWGTLIHEKKLRSKISCQTPFKAFMRKKLICAKKVTKLPALTVTIKFTEETWIRIRNHKNGKSKEI